MEESIFVSSLNISQVVTLKLTPTNYLLWKTQFESYLSSHLLLGFVTGATPRPASTIIVTKDDIQSEEANPEFLKWTRIDQLVKAWIFGSLSEEALKVVIGLNSAQEVWLGLARRFNRVSTTRKYDLQKRLGTSSKAGKTMDAYLSEVKNICDQLDSIGFPITEQEKIVGVLNGLGKEYESIATVIEHSLDVYPGPCFDDVVYKLTTFDDKLSTYTANSEVTPHLAFYTDKSYSSRGNNNSRGGRYGNFRGRGSYSTRGRGFHQQFGYGSNNGSGNGSKPTCQICRKYGHSAFKCYKRFEENYLPEDLPNAFAATRVSDQNQASSHEWLPDSAAIAHITNTTDGLQNSQTYSGDDSVIVGNGDFLPITHIGTIPLNISQGTLPLEDVLVCPGITKSLLSVSKLTDDYPCSFTFDSDSVVIKDKRTQQLLTQGNKHKGLYVLKDVPFQAYYSTRQQSSDDEVWHQRLGHPNKEVLQHLIKTKAIVVNKTSSNLCEACQMGKVCRLPFVASEFVSSRPLERIHCDLWGPAPVTSAQGFQYYVIFIDNYSRFTWIYPLKLKSDFFSVFVLFQQLVENQYQHKIAMFHCDGGGEFVSNKFVAHLASCGIKQLISCPHTPQQNGIAERRHRYLTELGLSLMFHSKVPHKLWVKAFFTSNFLSNLLPSSTLSDNKSPYEMLHGTPPVYTALRVFGSACYPYLRPYAKNKFDPKSLLCVFLGYNNKYKGYRCLHPPTGKVYICRHVLFDERKFPYSDIYSQFQTISGSPLFTAWQKGFSSTALSRETPSTNVEDIIFPSATVSSSVPTGCAPNIAETATAPDVDVAAAHDMVVPPSPITSTSLPTQPEESTSDQNHYSTDSKTAISSAMTPQSINVSLFEDSDFPPLQSVISSTTAAPETSHPMITRAKSGITKPNPKYALFSVKSSYPEPKSVKEALKDEGWTNAMGEEMGTMHETDTWDLVPPEMVDRLLGCKWVFKTKLNSDGSLDRLKARLVARGYEQEEGVDYVETYSPIVGSATVRSILHVATINKWSLKQLDVKNAFLHDELKETVFMTQPPGFEDPSRPDYVCKLKKAIYGLKQAPRAWFDKFSSYLLKYGFICSFSDPSLFVYLKGRDVMFLLLYVDDMILTGNNDVLLQQFRIFSVPNFE